MSVLAHMFGFRKRLPGLPVVLWRMRRGSWSTRLALLLILGAAAAGFATYGALNAAPPFGDDPNAVIWLLNIDLIILLLLVSLVARRMVTLWIGRRKGMVGSRLHVRLVLIFSMMAAAPAVIMTVFATFFLHFGVQSWFSDRISTAVNESQAVAQAYLDEHIQMIRGDVLATAYDLDRQAAALMLDPAALRKTLQAQSLMRGISEALIFVDSGDIAVRWGQPGMLSPAEIPKPVMDRAAGGEVMVIAGGNDGENSVRALVKLGNFPNSYLFVGRMADPTVLSHVTMTRKAVKEYERLEVQRSDLQVKITLIFVVAALLLLFAAIWFGLVFARQLVVPVSALISAADRVRAGDLTARVPEFERPEDELDILARAFNRMTSQIQSQRDELIAANRQLDNRSRFTEAVLEGVSSGVVGLDAQGRITLANASAVTLLGRMTPDELTGQDIAVVLPNLNSLLEQARQKPGRVTEGELPLAIPGEETRRTLLVRIAVDTSSDEQNGAVLTFDDISALQAAQRKAAWADVARRIAHEIKNPLTPIQLSAERLKRKYLKQITEDSEIFSQCTDTIVQHVGDIGRMVDEFSAFARMPEPVMKTENIVPHIRDLTALEQQAHPDIRFTLRGATAVTGLLDARQIRQAYTNILQNAIDSVEARAPADPRIDILIRRRPQSGDALIVVTDNGLGLPKHEDVSRLTEPYVTHKERGTGLGLAIVKKIMEDHGGRVVLGAPDWLKNLEDWQDLGGASVALVLPVDGESAATIERKQAIS